MGIKKMFKKKEPTEGEIRDELAHIGVTTKSQNKTRDEKFGAFRNYAQERQNAKPGFQPVNPYANVNNGNGNSNPYAQQGGGGGADGGAADGNNSSPYDTQTNPYGSRSERASNPYGNGGVSSGARGERAGGRNGQSNPYGGASASRAGGSKPNPYGAVQNEDTESINTAVTGYADPYSNETARASRQSTRRPRAYDEESLDLNAIPSNQVYTSTKPIRRTQMGDDETLDLNELPEEDDLNVDVDDLPEQEQVNSEDEEVEAIKQDIRFVKQESVGSTRNTLRMAQEADASATNTLGMLGSQSERLYNAELNLLLADTQSKIADQKVKDLKRYNRSIFVPAYGNPFNKKSRLRQQEMQIKAEKAQEKYLRDTNRKEMYASEQRIKQGINQNATNSDIHQKYRNERDLEAAKRYQFENDSEDDEMEKELASNLDQIGLYSKKLQSSALTMGKEVDSQNQRLGKIEEDADRLDINVHMNSARLNNIR
ncbi:Protein transport protein SEC9 [Debaryomyces fabryi]|uniref:Protein transport protein SEC9 n=1 Tax=Debaryomyces fabryi TaxID=58627 RepID=A0A0V1Q643_9ASCO|nr:Protein transport protein SEC9 [Debaryomyces fabryi]KSA03954.1 Protein transport protein SEC9 [Debaryomyces fabryi]CUM53864.1 unnamed protein product [Debaryomyces fabryi]